MCASDHWKNSIFLIVYLITEHLGEKNKAFSSPGLYPKKMSFQRNALTSLILRGASRGYMWVCFTPWYWSREWGHKACPHPHFVPLLSWQNPITTQCSNNRLQIRGKEERIITLKCHGGNLFLSTQHSRGWPQKHFPACACVDACVLRLSGNEKHHFFICFSQLPLVTLTAAEKHQKYSLIREAYKRRVNFNHLRTCVAVILSCSLGWGS